MSDERPPVTITHDNLRGTRLRYPWTLIFAVDPSGQRYELIYDGSDPAECAGAFDDMRRDLESHGYRVVDGRAEPTEEQRVAWVDSSGLADGDAMRCAFQALAALTDDRRVEVMARFCPDCGRRQPEDPLARRCQCRNDE